MIEVHTALISAVTGATRIVTTAEPEADPLPVASYHRAIRAHVDTIASLRQYDGGTSLASYIGSTNPKWAAEAAAFVAWRDTVWSIAHGAISAATPLDELIASLPEIVWP